MAELQSFSNAVPVVETAAPQSHGSDIQDAARAIGNSLNTIGGLQQGAAKQAQANAEAKQTGALAQASIYAEDFKRREPLLEAQEAGFLTENQVLNFGADEKESLEALNQAAAQGMGASVKNALERSIRYQFAAMQNPGAAKELATAYGVGNNSPEQDTLDALEKVERDRLKADADRARELAAEEGYDEFLGKSDEEVLEMWIDSPASQRERQIKQAQRSALSQEASIAERAPSASRAMSLELSGIAREMHQIEAEYMAATGGRNQGNTGSSMSLAEQYTLWAEDKIAQAARTYADFPKLLETYSAGIRRSVESKLEGRKKGIDIGTAEFNAQVKRPLEVAKLREELESRVFQNSLNPITALDRAFDMSTNVSREETRLAQMADDIVNRPAEYSENMANYLQSSGTRQRIALLSADAREQTSLMLNKLLDPERGNMKQASDDAIVTLESVIRDGGVAQNEAAVKKIISDITLAYEHGVENSPTKAKILEQSIMTLAEDPRFIEIAESSPAVRALSRPFAEGIKADVVESLQRSLDVATKDRVNSWSAGNLKGSKETRLALWRKLGQYMIVDKQATNEAGVPQYKLVNNIEEALTQEDIVNQQGALDEHNRSVLMQSDPQKYRLLKNLTGARSIGDAVEQVVESNEGIALESLSPSRTIPNRELN